MKVSIFDRAQSAVKNIGERLGQWANTSIDTVVVLGSGLGQFAETLVDQVVIPYEAVPEFVRSSRGAQWTTGDRSSPGEPSTYCHYAGPISLL